MVVYDDIAENKVIIYDKGIDTIASLGKNMDFDDLKPVSFNHRSGDIFIPKINLGISKPKMSEKLVSDAENFKIL